jgi:hypothetical protein
MHFLAFVNAWCCALEIDADIVRYRIKNEASGIVIAVSIACIGILKLISTVQTHVIEIAIRTLFGVFIAFSFFSFLAKIGRSNISALIQISLKTNLSRIYIAVCMISFFGIGVIYAFSFFLNHRQSSPQSYFFIKSIALNLFEVIAVLFGCVSISNTAQYMFPFSILGPNGSKAGDVVVNTSGSLRIKSLNNSSFAPREHFESSLSKSGSGASGICSYSSIDQSEATLETKRNDQDNWLDEMWLKRSDDVVSTSPIHLQLIERSESEAISYRHSISSNNSTEKVFYEDVILKSQSGIIAI